MTAMSYPPSKAHAITPRKARVLPLWILPSRIPGFPVEVFSFSNFVTVFWTQARSSGESPRSSAILEYIDIEVIGVGRKLYPCAGNKYSARLIVFQIWNSSRTDRR